MDPGQQSWWNTPQQSIGYPPQNAVGGPSNTAAQPPLPPPPNPNLVHTIAMQTADKANHKTAPKAPKKLSDFNAPTLTESVSQASGAAPTTQEDGKTKIAQFLAMNQFANSPGLDPTTKRAAQATLHGMAKDVMGALFGSRNMESFQNAMSGIIGNRTTVPMRSLAAQDEYLGRMSTLQDKAKQLFANYQANIPDPKNVGSQIRARWDANPLTDPRRLPWNATDAQKDAMYNRSINPNSKKEYDEVNQPWSVGQPWEKYFPQMPVEQQLALMGYKINPDTGTNAAPGVAVPNDANPTPHPKLTKEQIQSFNASQPAGTQLFVDPNNIGGPHPQMFTQGSPLQNAPQR